jgi:hypothetical protein
MELDAVSKSRDQLSSVRIQDAWSGDGQPCRGGQCEHGPQKNIYAFIILNPAEKKDKFFPVHVSLLMTEKPPSEAAVSDHCKASMRSELPGLPQMLGREYMNNLSKG